MESVIDILTMVFFIRCSVVMGNFILSWVSLSFFIWSLIFSNFTVNLCAAFFILVFSSFCSSLNPKIQFNSKFSELRVVQTQAISFLKSLSERVGSDIERLWIRMTLSRSRNSSFNFRVVISRIRLFPTLISNIKWLGSGDQTLDYPKIKIQ